MATFRYKAVLEDGISVFGTEDAPDDAALAAQLKFRGLELEWQERIAVHDSLTESQEELPRLVQLRIGERIREALLSGLPAHEAVRAVAAEPLDHPIMMLFPWLIFSCGCLTLAGLLLTRVMNLDNQWAWGVFLLALPILILLQEFARYQLVWRPRMFLQRMATKLESGLELNAENSGLLPLEFRAVAKSSLSSAAQGRVMAELLPLLGHNTMARNRVAVRMTGPLLMGSLLSLLFVASLVFVVPAFREIFEDFGIEIPQIARLFISISDLLTVPGWFSLPLALLVQLAAIAGFWCLLISPRFGHMGRSLPLIGTSLRSLAQARFARLLAVMLRNGAAPADAVNAAGYGSGDRGIWRESESLGRQLEESQRDLSSGPVLEGLPISLLRMTEADQNIEQRRGEVADVFSGIAAALESAAGAHSSLLVLIVEMVLVISAGMLTAMFALAFFQPLFRQLGGLAQIMVSPMLIAEVCR